MHVSFILSWKHWFCSECFQDGFHFLPLLWAPETFVWGPPRTARHSAAAPVHHSQHSQPPWLEAFHHSAQILELLGLWKHSWNIFFCAIEKPAWKIPAASISLPQVATPNCFAARFCVTKGISPANRTFEQTGESGLSAFRAITSHHCVCPSSELSNQISCVYEYKYCCSDPWWTCKQTDYISFHRLRFPKTDKHHYFYFNLKWTQFPLHTDKINDLRRKSTCLWK